MSRVRNIIRLDADPLLVLHDILADRAVAIDHRRAVLSAAALPNRSPKNSPHRIDLPLQLDALHACEDVKHGVKNPTVYFQHQTIERFVWQQTSVPRMGAGSIWFVHDGRHAFQAKVVSTSVTHAHALTIDLDAPTRFEPVPFKPTPVPKKFWPAAGYTAVIEYAGRAYGTIAALSLEALAASFGRQFASGPYDVHDPVTGRCQHFA